MDAFDLRSPLTAPGKPTKELTPDCRIAVVHPTQVTRSLLARSLKDQGFVNVQPFADLQSTIEYMEAEPLDWIWTPCFRNETHNVLQLLELVCSEDSLKHLRVSAFFEKSEEPLIPVAFELGLLSWHRSQTSSAGFESEIRSAVNSLGRHNHITSLASAEQLCNFLKETKDASGRRALFSTLAELFPNKEFAVMNDAEAKLSSGNVQGGLRSLLLAKKQNMKGWKELAHKHLGPKHADLSDESLFEIESYLIVEPDESVHNHIEELMKPFGAKRVHRFTDGEKALRWLENRKPPDLIIQEWKIPSVGGSNFLQRLRHSSASETPVLVVSSLLKKADVPILKEMGVASAVPKPLIDHEFVSSLAHTMTEFGDPKSLRFIERKVKCLLEKGEKEQARAIAAKLDRDKKVPESSKLFVRGMINYFDNQLSTAKRQLMDAVSKGGDSLNVLPLLARTLVKLREFKGAAACYEKAQSLSPRNVYRLFELAETYTELKKPEAANTSLSKAEVLDPKNPEIHIMRARNALSRGDAPAAAQHASALQDKEALIADLNNSGVAYVKSGQIKQGIDLYEKTIRLLAENETELRQKVLYNLALAQARSGDYTQARRSLEGILRSMRHLPVEERQNGPLFEKASSLHVKLTHAIATGTLLSFKQEVKATTVLNESFWKRVGGERQKSSVSFVRSSTAQPGERCCHLIYRSSDLVKQKQGVAQLVATKLKFTPRETIQKESSNPILGTELDDFEAAFPKT